MVDLFAQLGIKSQHSKYVIRARDMIEEQMQLAMKAQEYEKVAQLLSIIRRFPNDADIAYLQEVLSCIESKPDSLTNPSIQKVTGLCILILADLVENSTMEYLLTSKILEKKYPKILKKVGSYPHLQRVLVKFKGGVR